VSTSRISASSAREALSSTEPPALLLAISRAERSVSGDPPGGKRGRASGKRRSAGTHRVRALTPTMLVDAALMAHADDTPARGETRNDVVDAPGSRFHAATRISRLEGRALLSGKLASAGLLSSSQPPRSSRCLWRRTRGPPGVGADERSAPKTIGSAGSGGTIASRGQLASGAGRLRTAFVAPRGNGAFLVAEEPREPGPLGRLRLCHEPERARRDSRFRPAGA
jgi:hypothetical protein